MIRRIATDVPNRIVERINDRDGEVHRQVFVTPIVDCCGHTIAKDGPSGLIGVNSDTGIAKSRQYRGHQALDRRAMNEKCFQRVAYTDALSLGVVNDVAGHLEVGRLIEEDVDDTRTGFDDGNL